MPLLVSATLPGQQCLGIETHQTGEGGWIAERETTFTANFSASPRLASWQRGGLYMDRRRFYGQLSTTLADFFKKNKKILPPKK